MVPHGHTHSTGVVRSAADAAMQRWHEDEPAAG